MKIIPIIVLVTLVTLSSNAEKIHSISTASFDRSEKSFTYDHTGDGDIFADIGKIETSYFWSGRTIVGPLDQFKYVEPGSYISVSHSYVKNDYRNLAVGLISRYGSAKWKDQKFQLSRINGRYYKNNYFLGADLTHNTLYSEILGGGEIGVVLFDKLELSLSGTESWEEEFGFSASTSYEHFINEKSYIGVTASVSENSKKSYLGLKYFLGVSDNYYLSNDITLNEDYWKLVSSFYFNKRLSLSLGYTNDNDLAMIGSRYYLTKNISLDLQYSDGLEDYYTSKVSISAQF